MKLIDLTGRRIGRLVVLERAPNRGRFVAFRCLCDCGNEITTTARNLRVEHTQSCGCLCRERTALANTTHGDTRGYQRSREYYSWAKMIQRCTNENDPNYDRYGARGIAVCARWMKFECFIEDMGRAPHGFTLDRKNNDGNYEPGNCRWASSTTQANNRSSNRLLTHRGVTKTLSEWAKEIGIKRSTLGMRVNAYRWPIARALGE